MIKICRRSEILSHFPKLRIPSSTKQIFDSSSESSRLRILHLSASIKTDILQPQDRQRWRNPTTAHFDWAKLNRLLKPYDIDCPRFELRTSRTRHIAWARTANFGWPNLILRLLSSRSKGSTHFDRRLCGLSLWTTIKTFSRSTFARSAWSDRKLWQLLLWGQLIVLMSVFWWKSATTSYFCSSMILSRENQVIRTPRIFQRTRSPSRNTV